MSGDSRTRPTDDDEGKNVLDASGERVGIVTAVEEGAVHVETDPGITDEITARLGWGDTEDTHTVSENEIERITDDALRLQSTEPSEPGGPDASDAPGTGTPTESGSETGGERTDETTSEGMAHDPDEEPSTGEAATRGVEEENTDLSAEEETTGVGAEEHPESGASAPGTMDSGRPDEGPPAEDIGDADRRRGSEDVADPAPEEPRGSEDVADPTPEEPRDTEDVREKTDRLSEDDQDDDRDRT